MARRQHNENVDPNSTPIVSSPDPEAAQQWFQSLFAPHPIAAFLLHKSGKILAVNDSAALLFMRQASELIGQPWENFCLSHQTRLAHEQIATVASGTSSQPFLIAIQGPEQSAKLVNVTIAPLDSDAPYVILLATPVEKLTTEVGALSPTQWQQHELRNLIETIADGVLIFDSEGVLIMQNTLALTLYGSEHGVDQQPERLMDRLQLFRPHTLLGKPLTMADLPVARALRGEILKGDQTMDVVLHLPDGTETIVNESAMPLHGADGTVTGAMLVLREVTERRLNEQRTRQLLDDLLAMTRIVHIIDDAHGDDSAQQFQLKTRIVELVRHVLNCKAAAYIGYDAQSDQLHPEILIGFTPEQTAEITAYSADHTLASILAYDQQGAIQTDEIIFFHLQHISLPIPEYVQNLNVVAAPLRIGEQVPGFLVIFVPATEINEHAKWYILMQALVRLTSLIFDRALLLKEREGQRAREWALTETTRRLDQFVGLASHEIRTPLTTIIGSLQILERYIAQLQAAIPESPLHTRVQFMLQHGIAQAQRLNRFVSDLLDVTALQFDELQLHLDRHDLGVLLRQSLKEARTLAPEQVFVFRDETLLANSRATLVEVDRERIQQVIEHFISNAIKFSPPGSPIHITLRHTAASALIEVCDLGPGIALAEQPRIWDRFYRIGASDQESMDVGSQVGVGLGLYLSRVLVKMQGGEVGIDSTPGAGSTFWLSLPLVNE